MIERTDRLVGKDAHHAWSSRRCDAETHARLVPNHGRRDRPASRSLVHKPRELARAPHAFAIELDDEVARLDPGSRRGALRPHLLDDRALGRVLDVAHHDTDVAATRIEQPSRHHRRSMVLLRYGAAEGGHRHGDRHQGGENRGATEEHPRERLRCHCRPSLPNKKRAGQRPLRGSCLLVLGRRPASIGRIGGTSRGQRRVPHRTARARTGAIGGICARRGRHAF